MRAALERPWVRRAAIVVAFVVALNVLGAVLTAAFPEPSGPVSSSYATAPTGLAAYADLLRGAGHAVSRLRERPNKAPLDPQLTLVVLDPDDVDPTEARALRRFVERGGRLVAGGKMPGTWLRELLPRPPDWASTGPRVARPLAPAPETADVGEVATAGEGAWTRAAGSLPVLGTGTESLMVVAPLGRGRVVLMADPSPLQNRLLATGDNAALGLGVAGEPGRPVQFAETVHGYGEQKGLDALPTRWKLALGGLVLAALAFLLARGRRLGPAEDESRPLPPPRSAYAHALAATLARTGQPDEAAGPVKAEARARLARRAGLPPDAQDEEALRQAATRAGLAPDETEAVLGAVTGEESALAAGRALQQLNGRAERLSG